MPARMLFRAVLCTTSLGLGLERFVTPHLDIFRADPSEALQNGRDGFERIARGVMNG